MIMHDYNPSGTKLVLLLHPMLASGEMMYQLLGRHLGGDVRCLAPDFASHGAERGTEFAGAAAEADKIMEYLREQGIGHVDLAYGASLGGVVLTRLLERGLSFSTAFFEGTSFFENARLLTKLVGSKFVQKHRRAAADHERAVQAMGKLYGDRFAEEFADQFISMSEDSIRGIAASCGDNRHVSLSPEDQKKCVFAYGSKDFNVPKAKPGCKKYYPHARFILWKEYGHCEKITADTVEYVSLLKGYLK